MTVALGQRVVEERRQDTLLRVQGLTVGFPAGGGWALAADGVEFRVDVGETLGLVGESGCGKSVSLRALLGVVPVPGAVLAGTAMWRDECDLLSVSRRRLRAVRGKEIGMVFQDPEQSLNPVISVGDQLIEILTKRAGRRRKDARRHAVRLLDRMGIPSPERRLNDYPHQLSGGMRQRVMIAMAVACEPALLLADEPTTALDVTIQEQILDLLTELQAELGMSMILVSHDLGVIGQACDRVAVMYAGHIVETGTVDQVLHSPRHPYSAGLIAAVPSLPGEEGRQPLQAIAGQPPSITALPEGCPFRPRCAFDRDDCRRVDMTLDADPGGHRSACPMVHAAREGVVGRGAR